ncbi:TIGR03915 family putative DNA repair protein [Mucilaginibacter sp. Bleaf8]|uniref:TIGR03915 family putative DNA repair protein n=1 Tax=Mucilaginibacter sp. Bleaf8 TaxID=2834430 RepID=UPI001BCAFEF9|nr:TIGR03915 family putative DNA repair protein [Mucilaginibacter sp. Bleaf8]MBS7563121.1 TIGR03915 family putative DNA repair protein [Mucilaginibacter sp. Bleaf8]
MTTLIYDGTFEGLLTAVFEIYERKLSYVKIRKGEWLSTALFEDVLQIYTDSNRAARVLKGLQQKLSNEGMKRLYIAHLADMDDEDSMLVGYIRYVFDSPHNVEEDYGNKYVLRLSEMVRMVRREKHRMEAFIRFQELADTTFYSAIEPDFNVLPLLSRHFKDRYTDQKWIIYDLKRNYGLYYDLHDVQCIALDFSTSSPSNVISAFSENEGLYQRLWQNYFKSVNIPARKNTKLHMRHIPKRYWRHLTEKF